MSQLIRVIFADDHPVVRRGLAAMIDIEDDIEVVGVAKNGEEALKLVHAQQPDIVLMDLQMPIMDGVEATKRIRRTAPHIPVLILTTFDDEEYIYDGIAAGARGYLLKDADPDQLIDAIRAASRGESLLDPVVAARVLDRFYYIYEYHEHAIYAPTTTRTGSPTHFSAQTHPSRTRSPSFDGKRATQQSHRQKTRHQRTHRESACGQHIQQAECEQSYRSRGGGDASGVVVGLKGGILTKQEKSHPQTWVRACGVTFSADF